MLGFATLQEMVNWAAEAIVLGYDSPSLHVLAGLQGPLDELEVNRLFTKIAEEFEVIAVLEKDCIPFYIAPIIRKAVKGELAQKEVLEWLKELCWAENARSHREFEHFHKDLKDFYLLYEAQLELERFGAQWYWKGATPENIDQIISDYLKNWLKSHDERVLVK